jgi:hypothetical protein
MTKRKSNGKRYGVLGFDAERPANLSLWYCDGAGGGDPVKGAEVEVSIGRAASKRTLGFVVVKGKDQERIADFVLTRDQVCSLIAYLRFTALPALRGRKRPLHTMNDPMFRLTKELEDAAIDAHPGWRKIDDHIIEQDELAPDGDKLIKWFKKTHPRKAARIEREFTRGIASRAGFGTKPGPARQAMPLCSALTCWNVSHHNFMPGRIMHAVVFGD